MCAPRPASSGGRRAAKATAGVRPSPPPVAEKDPSTKHTWWWENVPNSAYPGSPERETGHTAAASHRAPSGPERRQPQMGRNTRQELRNSSQALVPADGAVSCLEAGGGNTPYGATAAIPSAAPAPPVPHADLEAMGGAWAGKDQEACPACPAESPGQASQPWSVKPELVMAVPEPLDSPREGGHKGIYILLCLGLAAHQCGFGQARYLKSTSQGSWEELRLTKHLARGSQGGHWIPMPTCPQSQLSPGQGH